MPIEIRELIIKTEISSAAKNNVSDMGIKELEALKTQLLEECKRIIATKTKKNIHKR
jgi:hypothetical protein